MAALNINLAIQT